MCGIKVPQSMQETWKTMFSKGPVNAVTSEQVTALGDAANADGNIDVEEQAFLDHLNSNLVTSANHKSGAQPVSFVENHVADGQVDVSDLMAPASMQAEWDQFAADGKLNSKEFDGVISLLKLRDTTEAEFEFMKSVRERVAPQAGTEKVSTHGTSKAAADWPGYNADTNGALKTSFGDANVILSSKKVPLLTPALAKQITDSVGVGSVQELQKLVGAKVDGKFGPETFYKVKAYMDTQLAANPEQPTLEKMDKILGNLGEDKKVGEMKGRISELLKKPAAKETPKFTDPIIEKQNHIVADNTRVVINKPIMPMETGKTTQQLNNVARDLLKQADIEIPADATITRPNNPGVNGDIKITGKDFEMVVYNNTIKGRDANKHGDFHVVGTANGKKVDMNYWENHNRGNKSIEKFGLVHLDAKINGEKNSYSGNENVLSEPINTSK